MRFPNLGYFAQLAKATSTSSILGYDIPENSHSQEVDEPPDWRTSESVSLQQAEWFVGQYCDSYSTLPVIIELYGRMHETDWLALLGKFWSCCDNITAFEDDLLETSFGFFLESPPITEMMSPEASAIYESLPSEFVVYRGCYAPNKWGLSWSLSRDVAERFPFLRRYRQTGQPLLVKARLRKEQVVAVMTDRNETEIIALRPKHISTCHLRPPAITAQPVTALSP